MQLSSFRRLYIYRPLPPRAVRKFLAGKQYEAGQVNGQYEFG